VQVGAPSRIDAIDTIALTMGAKQVCDQAFEWSTRHPIESVLVDDAAAVRGCTQFLDDHRTLVEPACGAVLSVVYDALPIVCGRGPVLVVVCGGAGVTRSQIDGWARTFRA
jgi:L-serine/L-threonine ammonia-lyase